MRPRAGRHNRLAVRRFRPGAYQVLGSRGNHDTNQVCENSGNDPRVDVEYSNNCPYGATRVMFREAGGPGAVQFVVIATGSGMDAALIAFALPGQ